MGLTRWDYYSRVATRISREALSEITTREQWEAARETRRRQFLQAMGLDPQPEGGELGSQQHGEFRGEGYRAECVSFQVLPGVHATANLYRPDPLPAGKLPAVLYLCGHHLIGVHAYQGHAAMWARRGYVCLVLDTMEQHDNRGDHHALYYGRRPDWISRGYSAAGGEVWCSMRGVDLLLSLPEVDPKRIGATGLSGGGAQSFLVTVADPRIACGAPFCGVETLEFHIAAQQWMHHCDCMWPNNMFQQDASDWAALVAPRPLLLGFASEDSLFSAEGYKLLFGKTRRIYGLLGAEDKCDLCEYPGPHGYRPQSTEAINRWFDKHLAQEPHPMLPEAELEHDEATTTVFNGAPPAEDRLDILPELMTRRAELPIPDGQAELTALQTRVKAELLAGPLSWLTRADDRLELTRIGDYVSENGRRSLVYRGEVDGVTAWAEMDLPAEPTGKVLVGLVAPGQMTLELQQTLAICQGPHASVTLEARGGGFNGSDSSNAMMTTQLLRAGACVGITQTMLGIRDLLLALDFLRGVPELAGQEPYLYGKAEAGVSALYAGLLDEGVAGVVAESAPRTHLEGAYIPGILRVVDMKQLVGLLATRFVGVSFAGPVRSLWADRLYRRLGYGERFTEAGTQSAVRMMMEG